MSLLFAVEIRQPWIWCLTDAGAPLLSLPLPPPSTAHGQYLALYAPHEIDEGAIDYLRMNLGLDIRDLDRALMFRPGILATCKLRTVHRVVDELAPDLGLNLPDSWVSWIHDKTAWIVDEVRSIPLVTVHRPNGPLWKVEGDLLSNVRHAWRSAATRPPHRTTAHGKREA